MKIGWKKRILWFFITHKFLFHVLMILVSCIISGFVARIIMLPELIYLNVWSILCFTMAVLFVPIVFLLLCWKHPIARGYALAVVILAIIFALLCFLFSATVVDRSISNYLSENSDLSKIASEVLPGHNEISQAETASYLYFRSGLLPDQEAIELTLTYSKELYDEVVNNINSELRSAIMLNFSDQHAPEQGVLLFDSHQYLYYSVTKDGIHCLIAYRLCQESRSISYLVFWDYMLSSLSPSDAINSGRFALFKGTGD